MRRQEGDGAVRERALHRGAPALAQECRQPVRLALRYLRRDRFRAGECKALRRGWRRAGAGVTQQYLTLTPNPTLPSQALIRIAAPTGDGANRQSPGRRAQWRAAATRPEPA